MDSASPWHERIAMARWPMRFAIVYILLCWIFTVVSAENTTAENTTASAVNPKCLENNCTAFVNCKTMEFKLCANRVYRENVSCNDELKNLKTLFYHGYLKIHNEFCADNNTLLRHALIELDTKRCWKDYVVCIAPHLGLEDTEKLNPKNCKNAWSKTKECTKKTTECEATAEVASKELFNTGCGKFVDLSLSNGALEGHVIHLGLIVAALISLLDKW